MTVSASPTIRAARWLALLLPLALLGGAYLGQYVFGLVPCEMCWWQRYPHMAAIALAALAFVRRPVAAPVALAAIAILLSGVIGAFHAGVEYGWWQGLTACTASPLAGGGDPLDAILKAPVVRCDAVQWSLFGISLAGWNFLISTAGALLMLGLIAANRTSGRDHRR